jgi:hypothetical protein
MSRNIIFVLTYHRHKLLDLNYKMRFTTKFIVLYMFIVIYVRKLEIMRNVGISSDQILHERHMRSLAFVLCTQLFF